MELTNMEPVEALVCVLVLLVLVGVIVAMIASPRKEDR